METRGTEIILVFQVLGHIPVGLRHILGNVGILIVGDHVDAVVRGLGSENGIFHTPFDGVDMVQVSDLEPPELEQDGIAFGIVLDALGDGILGKFDTLWSVDWSQTGEE